VHPALQTVVGCLLLFRAGCLIPEHRNQNWISLSENENLQAAINSSAHAVYWATRFEVEIAHWGELRVHREEALEALAQEQLARTNLTARGGASARGKQGSYLVKSGHWLRKYYHKFKGQRQIPMPPSTWQFTWWAVLGTVICMLLIDAISQPLEDVKYGATFLFLMLNSIVSTIATLFAVPSSPLAQPRNILVGYPLSAAVAVALDLLSNPAHLGVIPIWVAAPLAAAIPAAALAKLGMMHPPACAVGMVYVLGAPHLKALSWLFIAIPVVTDAVLVVIVAVLINNLSRDRSFPLYW